MQVVVDLCTLSAAYWLAFLFRFEFSIPSAWLSVATLSWPTVLVIEYGTLAALGVPNYSWRYVSMREMLRIAVAVALASGLLAVVRLVLHEQAGAGLMVLPLGVLATNLVLAFVALAGVRAVRRLQGEAHDRRKRHTGVIDRHRVLLVGAGSAGVLVAREIQSRPDLALLPVGFVDDDPRKVGSHICGLPVLGTTDHIGRIAERKHVKRVLITIASAPGAEIRRITLACKDAGLETKIIPGLYEIVGDHLNLSRIREVGVEDLLGRAPVELDDAEIASSLAGKCVLVTGAGGSIGSEICRQVARFAPARLVLFERSEHALFEVHRELVAANPGLAIEPCIGDVGDARRVGHVMSASAPAVVFHAAAHKHVPMMEMNVGEAIKNNIGGTQVVAEAAHRAGVAQFVLISTDKAVNPTSVMGATKRVTELVCQSYAQRSRTRFVTVRFGNVLGSSGSVIPLFKEQIARGGPVVVTHPEMRRYFMTIPEAAQLVLQAGAMGSGGELFILDMGKPVRIVDLATDLIRLSGLRPGEDIEIVYSGPRPGEKLFEELATDAEAADTTKHPKIFIGRGEVFDADVERRASELVVLAGSAEAGELKRALRALVPTFVPPGEAAVAPPGEAAVAPHAAAQPSTHSDRRTGGQRALAELPT